jgi:hypothetical protein
MDAEAIAQKLNIQKKSVHRLKLRVKNRLAIEVNRLKMELG